MISRDIAGWESSRHSRHRDGGFRCRVLAMDARWTSGASMSNIRHGMSNISPDGLNPVLAALGEQLRARNTDIHLVVIGGSGLLAMGLSDRATQDVDVVAFVQEGRLVSAAPFPEVLEEAARRVSDDFGLKPAWLNHGPTSLLDFGLPGGFEERMTTVEYGPGLRVSFASRLDQIHLKLYAFATRREPRDQDRSPASRTDRGRVDGRSRVGEDSQRARAVRRRTCCRPPRLRGDRCRSRRLDARSRRSCATSPGTSGARWVCPAPRRPFRNVEPPIPRRCCCSRWRSVGMTRGSSTRSSTGWLSTSRSSVFSGFATSVSTNSTARSSRVPWAGCLGGTRARGLRASRAPRDRQDLSS